MDTRILCINPGATSTKVAVYHNETPLFSRTIRHAPEELAPFPTAASQLELRCRMVRQILEEQEVAPASLSAVVGRGGLLPPVRSGAYLVNDAMLRRLREAPVEDHASNLGALIAHSIASPAGIPPYIYDSVAVDEMWPLARLTGFPESPRTCLCHTLNARAVAHRSAAAHGKRYQDMTFIVAHLGSGFTVSVHHKGRMVDITDNDEGPFGPESCGRISTRRLLKLAACYDMDHLKKRARGSGGLMGHLGTSDAQVVEQRVLAGDDVARLVYETMAYQIAKAIGELATTVCGQVDAILLTGGVARSQLLTGWITQRVSFLAPVELWPGEDELEALAMGARRVLLGEESPHMYQDTEIPG